MSYQGGEVNKEVEGKVEKVGTGATCPAYVVNSAGHRIRGEPATEGGRCAEHAHLAPGKPNGMAAH